jgi:hypothetical protein
MTETVEKTGTRTVLVDEFLSKHGAGLPNHIVDFALDMRALVAELEALLDDRLPAAL